MMLMLILVLMSSCTVARRIRELPVAPNGAGYILSYDTIIMVGIKMFLAETVTQLGPFYLKKTAICWPGWPARFEIIIIH